MVVDTAIQVKQLREHQMKDYLLVVRRADGQVLKAFYGPPIGELQTSAWLHKRYERYRSLSVEYPTPEYDIVTGRGTVDDMAKNLPRPVPRWDDVVLEEI